MPSLQRRRGTRKSGVLGTHLGVRWQNLNTRRTIVKASLKKKVWSSAQRWLTCGAQPWTTWTSLHFNHDDVDEKFDIDDENWDHCWNTVDVVADEILPAIVPERDKECHVTASEQTRKKTTWSMLDRTVPRVLEEGYTHTCWWYELCRDEKCEGCSQQQVWRRQVWPRQWRLLAWCDPRSSAEDRLLPKLQNTSRNGR